MQKSLRMHWNSWCRSAPPITFRSTEKVPHVTHVWPDHLSLSRSQVVFGPSSLSGNTLVPLLETGGHETSIRREKCTKESCSVRFFTSNPRNVGCVNIGRCKTTCVCFPLSRPISAVFSAQNRRPWQWLLPFSVGLREGTSWPNNARGPA